MSINNIIIYIMVIFMLLGALDKIIGNKFGIGEKFQEGIMTMGPLALAMIGIVSLSPVMAKILGPIITPFYNAIGSDPSVFAATLLSCDMGGYNFAIGVAKTPDIALFSSLILGSMMGCTVVFTIPVAIGLIDEKDHKALAIGMLAGIITIPIGTVIGGLAAGYHINMVLINLIPVIAVTFLLALGLLKVPSKMIKGFNIFGKLILSISTLGLAAIAVETMTGIVIIPGMTPLSNSVTTVGNIAIVLSGAYPMVHVINKVFKKSLSKLGSALGINDIAASGLLASMASNIPTFGMLKDMDERGKIINCAFAVSGSFVFGGQLGYVASISKNMMLPMIAGKITGGISAVVVASLILSPGLVLKKETFISNTNNFT